MIFDGQGIPDCVQRVLEAMLSLAVLILSGSGLNDD